MHEDEPDVRVRHEQRAKVRRVVADAFERHAIYSGVIAAVELHWQPGVAGPSDAKVHQMILECLPLAAGERFVAQHPLEDRCGVFSRHRFVIEAPLVSCLRLHGVRARAIGVKDPLDDTMPVGEC